MAPPSTRSSSNSRSISRRERSRQNLEPLLGRESDGVPFEARWLRLPEVLDGTHVVYPAGLPQRLTAWLDR